MTRLRRRRCAPANAGCGTKSWQVHPMSAVAELDRRPSHQGDESPSEVMTLVDRYLLEQQEISAVARFSQRHEAEQLPLQARYYAAAGCRPPAAGPGEQYAFEVDLDSCSGCKACVAACNALNGLDETETWRDVGLLHGGSDEQPFLQHVTAACHHCLDPACLNACPVRAYEKDSQTGIVRHLDDQCIGCQYCVLACPYDVPKYNSVRGIVRKCDMCSNRLAIGEAPACVQSCPNSAIRITTVSRQATAENCETGTFLPGAPDPQYTQPTTHYKTNRVFPRNTLPADYYSVQPEHAHWPLVAMLVLTQLSVGAFLVDVLLESILGDRSLHGIRSAHTAGALLFGLVALGASTLHLGRPHLAFRAVMGLRTSWLSREILAFGLFAALAVLSMPSRSGSRHLCHRRFRATFQTALGWWVVGTGLAGIVCSIMIYHCTRRPLEWPCNDDPVSADDRSIGTIHGPSDGPRWGRLLAVGIGRGRCPRLCRGVVSRKSSSPRRASWLFEASLFVHLGSWQMTPLRRSALLMTGDLAQPAKWRYALGVAGGILLPALWLWQGPTSPSAIAAVAGRCRGSI